MAFPFLIGGAHRTIEDPPIAPGTNLLHLISHHATKLDLPLKTTLAPNAKLRSQLTPFGRGKRPPTDEESTGVYSDHRSPEEKRRSMIWAQRVKHVFNIDVST